MAKLFFEPAPQLWLVFELLPPKICDLVGRMLRNRGGQIGGRLPPKLNSGCHPLAAHGGPTRIRLLNLEQTTGQPDKEVARARRGRDTSPTRT